MNREAFDDKVKKIEGTLAIENMKIGKDAMNGIKKIANGKATCSDVVEMLKNKYRTRI